MQPDLYLHVHTIRQWSPDTDEWITASCGPIILYVLVGLESYIKPSRWWMIFDRFPFNYFLFFSNWIKKKTSFTQQCLIKKKTDGLHLWIGKQLTLSHDTNHFRQKDFFGLWMLWDLSKRGKVLYPNVCKDMQKKCSRTNDHWYRLFIKAGCT